MRGLLCWMADLKNKKKHEKYITCWLYCASCPHCSWVPHQILLQFCSPQIKQCSRRGAPLVHWLCRWLPSPSWKQETKIKELVSVKTETHNTSCDVSLHCWCTEAQNQLNFTILINTKQLSRASLPQHLDSHMIVFLLSKLGKISYCL